MFFLSLFVMALVPNPGQSTEYNCSVEYNRIPDDSDMMVECGANIITLEVNLCTALWAGYNESTLALNGQHNNSLCKGVVDASVEPPVIRYQLPVNHSLDNPCRHTLEDQGLDQIVDEVPGPGVFSSFSKIQFVIFSSYIDTPQADEGVVSYSTDLYYHFSCRYPLEYLLNNTQITSSSVSVATTNNNGTFINTLSMGVYNDTDYLYEYSGGALDLRTQVYVEVKATNLTGNFYVLLDHCFATPAPFNVSANDNYDFFIGCEVKPRTAVPMNGVGKSARFSFEAFRFVVHRDQEMSTVYVHCILRLCEPATCKKLLDNCISGRRRRRSLAPFGSEAADSASITAGPITIKSSDAIDSPSSSAYGASGNSAGSGSNVTGLVVGLIFACAGAALLVMGVWFALKKFYLAGGTSRSFK